MALTLSVFLIGLCVRALPCAGRQSSAVARAGDAARRGRRRGRAGRVTSPVARWLGKRVWYRRGGSSKLATAYGGRIAALARHAGALTHLAAIPVWRLLRPLYAQRDQSRCIVEWCWNLLAGREIGGFMLPISVQGLASSDGRGQAFLPSLLPRRSRFAYSPVGMIP
jgi:hypothetical protein